jgi:N-acetylated-alpha-linked acidic dipeptidase
VLAERALCSREGLRDRPWFKHLVFAPGFFNNYGTDRFPAITDALCHTLVEEECQPDWRQVRSGVHRTATAVRYRWVYEHG